MTEESSKSNVPDGEIDPCPSSISMDKSSKKCNLSFSFNFDFHVANSEASSDSETADLQIDVSEVDNYEPPNKRKRDTIEETSSVINEMEEEIERQLDAKAAKTNLTATNVKNILKHVITNEHVMAMVQKRLHNTEDGTFFEPTLTRAKAKELAAAQFTVPWPITPLKKPSSEVQVLIEEELSEDSSDEEYNPEQDKHSDDDRDAENSAQSDIEVQPSMLENHCDTVSIEQPKSPNIQYDPEGVFKIPGIPHVPTEEENIGQRTRSKLCLSETSLEQIEQAFIPPDITTDMYDWDCDLDEDWDNFLKEFTRPLTQEPTMEDDPDADPEYNILEDEETDLLDKEELRADKAVKITRKELNNLIAELFEFTDTFSKQEQEISKKKKSSENTNWLVENNSLNCSIDMSISTEPEFPKLLNLEQRHLLATQLRQHVQLMAQHFAMTFMHPELRSLAKTCKQNLNSIKNLSNGPNSAFNAVNITDALKLVSDWENKFLDEKFCENIKKAIADDVAMAKIYSSHKWKYVPQFQPELIKLFIESKALMYPQLLPEIPFRAELKKYVGSPYLKSEECLVALGLEQFLPFVASKPRKFKSKRMQLMDAIQLINQYLLPCREPQRMFHHVQRRRSAKDWNPIKHYSEKGCAPRTLHYITLECELKAPKDQPIKLLPLRWQTYLNNADRKIDLLKRKHILNSYNTFIKDDYRINGHKKHYEIVPETHPLRNPVVNVLPKILPANVIQKNSSKNITKSTVCGNETSVETLGKASNIQVNMKSNIETVNADILPKANSACKHKKEQEKGQSSHKAKPEVQELPKLRRTTPRLAKTRSAQNMKLMAQVLGPKGLSSNCSTLKSRDKHESDKNAEKSPALSKVDNEDEIAELMLASSTIKKDSISRKKAKEAREMENIKRLLESENPLNEEERGSKFAASYLQKLHLTLESSSPETFRAVIKLYLEYNDKLENINQMESELSFSDASKSSRNEDTMESPTDKDAIAINLYRDVCEKLRDYPELCTDFLLFLKPHQAAMIDKSVEYMMLQKMSEFINVAQIYFAKQPSRIAKMMQGITQLSSDSHTTLENVHTVMSPILKGHPLVMDLFLQILPTAKPPESLFAPHMFENLTCPVGPHDKNKLYSEDAAELYENIELPVLPSQDDPYGGENCRCNCHNGDDTNLKSVSEHCVSCGTRFLNGRIYLQTTEGLRPAKIIFPGADEEKLENIARVSLKTTDRFVLPTSSRQRRKSTKNDSNNDDLYPKHCALKNSPVKDNEDGEKSIIKSKKVLKSPPKSSETKKSFKKLGSMEHIDVNNKKMRVTQCKMKRERKTDKRELKLGHENLGVTNSLKSNGCLFTSSGNSSKEAADECVGNAESELLNDNVNSEKTDLLSETKSGAESKSEVNTKPWTRQEDMILLQNIKKEYSENSLLMVSKILEDRSIEQVKDRCQTLLSLLEKMM